MSSALFVGIDCSTQSLKIVVVDTDKVIVSEAAVNFDAELPHYNVRGGVVRSTYGLKDVDAHVANDPLVITSPSLMFAEALDLALSKLVKTGVDLSRVAAISASGQQHGSVWWKHGSAALLKGLSSTSSLSASLADAFSLPSAPIWMDSSTAAQCRRLDDAVGGPANMARITGSRAYERFTANQILKIKELAPAVYNNTERISLVSSMVATMLTGSYQPIDASDGAGMNAMNIVTQSWERTITDYIDPTGELVTKLGEVVPSATVVGSIHLYFIEKYGFSPKAAVVASSGDNPCTLAGMELTTVGDVGISLGTSDTVFAVVEDAVPSADEGHVFINPVDEQTQMIMAVFKNGSVTRQTVRDRVAHGSWEAFNDALATTEPGNGGNMMFTYLEAEITPTTHKTGTFRFGPDDKPIEAFIGSKTTDASASHTDGANKSAVLSSAEKTEIRALIEAQFMSLRAHSESLGLTTPKRIVAAGGASANWALLQVLADVFQCPVEVQSVVTVGGDKNSESSKSAVAAINTAALGAAYRALWATHGKQSTHVAASTSATRSSVPTLAVKLIQAAQPNTAAADVFAKLLHRFKQLEQVVVKQLQ